MTHVTADRIVEWWLGEPDITPEDFGEKLKVWYAFDADIDQQIRDEFASALAAAENGELDEWQESEPGAIALVILFDQVTRNLYRGTADAFRNDTKALDIAARFFAAGRHSRLNVPAHLMMFHPMHHSEDVQQQSQVVQLAESLLAACEPGWQPVVKSSLEFQRGHAALIERFGRFPHRNAVLGRASTEAELAYLEEDNRSYGQ